MPLRVLVDICHQITQISFGGNFNPAERMLKQAACSFIGFVYGLGVRVEQVADLLARVLGQERAGKLVQGEPTLLFFDCPDAHECVEVVAQETIRVRISDRLDIVRVPLQKERIIPLFKKNGAAVDSSAKDVIVVAVLQRYRFGHDEPPS